MRRFLHRLLNRSTPVEVDPDSPSPDEAADAADEAAVDESRVPTEKLVVICDAYWKLALHPAGAAAEAGGPTEREYRQALDELPSRSKEILRWAAERLKHPNVEARVEMANLLGQIGSIDDLGPVTDQLVEVLGNAALRRTKDAPAGGEANIAALQALGELRNPRAIAPLRALLTASDWASDEVLWEAADALELVTGEPFMSEDKPVQLAREWLAENADDAE